MPTIFCRANIYYIIYYIFYKHMAYKHPNIHIIYTRITYKIITEMRSVR